VSILESIVAYMKDARGLSYHEIALILNRNDRTIWTVYNRTAKKIKESKEIKG
jgi:DNA-directed RNA polymerase specialized sigma24 family protein